MSPVSTAGAASATGAATGAGGGICLWNIEQPPSIAAAAHMSARRFMIRTSAS